MTFQIVPPNLHRTSTAERAIATFKDHFISGLASANPSFPMHLWCQFLPQATAIINLRQPLCINPRISAKTILNGEFNYNKTPLTPPGTKVIIHEAPLIRHTWDLHGANRWYLVPAPKHYRCHQCYITKTRAERIACTVELFPYLYDMPKTFSANAARDVAAQLTTTLLYPHPETPSPPWPRNNYLPYHTSPKFSLWQSDPICQY